MKFRVRTNEILAMMIFASRDEVRFTLNAVHFEIKKDRLPLLISTDGKRIAALESQAQQYTTSELDAAFTIRIDVLKTICNLNRQFGKNGDFVELDCDPSSEKLTASIGGGRLVLDWPKDALCSGKYPDWRKVILDPYEHNNVPDVAFNSEYVSDFAKAAKFLKVSNAIHIKLYPNLKPLEVRLCQAPYFYAMLMPIKADSINKWKPDFITLPLPKIEIDPAPIQPPTEQPTEKAA